MNLTQYLMRLRYDKTALLDQNSRREKRGVLCFGIEEMRGLYSSGRENMNGMAINEH